MGDVQDHRFTIDDVGRGQDMQSFVQRVTRDAKGCNQSELNQLRAAFEAFDSEIQNTTTVDSFLTEINILMPASKGNS
ncbi:hypothetical protein AAE478_005488 [Parahypoxylon ruwenzoriense]